MPRDKIKYDHTVFYRISCKDPTVTDFYIGHTTNIIKRKHLHKTACASADNNSLEIYNVIRNTGGWSNWKVTILEERSCANIIEAKEREKYHYQHEPPPNNADTKLYKCDNCMKSYKDRTGLWKHQKKCSERCAPPIYAETYRSPFNGGESYIDTVFSPKESLGDSLNIDDKKIEGGVEKKSRSRAPLNGRLCKSQITNELVLKLIEKNQELQELLLEQSAKIMELTSNSVVNNITNNGLNINMFLNERCKNAVNLKDFVDNLEIEFEDVEYVGTHGFVEGITKIFTNGLKQMGVHERPIHCTDLKRETLYIKDADKWEKESEDKARITNAITRVAHKNIQQIPKWYRAHPECDVYDTPAYDLHMSIMTQSMGGATFNEMDRNNEKILRNIAKNVLIRKGSLY